MLRAVTKIYIEGYKSKPVFKIIHACAYSSASSGEQTVTSNGAVKSSSTSKKTICPPASSLGADGSDTAQRPPPPPAFQPPSRHKWSAVAALTVGASLGGVYLYRKYNSVSDNTQLDKLVQRSDEKLTEEEPAVPATAEGLPPHAQYLVLGGGTAAFAAMRAIRSARPDAQVLLVAAERALPYMRPPLSKELWREPDLANKAKKPEELTFRQWNGRRRSVVYEPRAFYTSAERLQEGVAGAGLALGWRAVRLYPERNEVMLHAPGAVHTITYDKCLIATGMRARRVPALRAAAAAGRSVTLRSAADATRVAAELERDDTRTVLIVGGGLLAAEMAAALSERLQGSDKRVVQVYRERAPLTAVLPAYLAADAARRLSDAGVHLMPGTEVTGSSVDGRRITVQLSSGARLTADLVLECVGGEPETELADAAGLEVDPIRGGIIVNAELQARSDVYAAGDVTSFHDPLLGRRRVEHHDHAVVSGRLAGENMAAVGRAKAYTHQSMFWSDLGPYLGYEAIGVIDSKLRTVGVFSEDAVVDEKAVVAEIGTEAVQTANDVRSQDTEPTRVAVITSNIVQGGEDIKPVLMSNEVHSTEEQQRGSGEGRKYERGVVFYLRDDRVVGVLLWNLFNRMHIARQVLTQGKFEDLFEVAKLFTLHEDD